MTVRLRRFGTACPVGTSRGTQTTAFGAMHTFHRAAIRSRFSMNVGLRRFGTACPVGTSRGTHTSFPKLSTQHAAPSRQHFAHLPLREASLSRRFSSSVRLRMPSDLI